MNMDKNTLTLGSLFDGSGGFPLGGILCGIRPVWASEIEPFPIRVTTRRIPDMRHLGDISQIRGPEIEPVDIITFGSPCQDMSIAGKREGLDGNRSGLFHEAIRIAREMRDATDGTYPRFLVWENVPGAFSSNKGDDFRAVIQEIANVRYKNVSVPKPEKWASSGLVVEDGFSLAWRILDAQYWGVPQRRKRIYLVADLTGKCAGKILFESEGLPGDTQEGRIKEQGASSCSPKGAGGPEPDCLMFENHSQDSRYKGPLEKSQPVTSTFGMGGNNQPLVMKAPTFDVRFTSEGTRNTRQNCYETETARTIDTGGNAPDSNQGGVAVVQPRVYGICSKGSNAMLSDNPKSGFYEASTTRTLDANGGSPSCNQGGMAVVSIEGNGARPSHKGCGYSDKEKMFTLNATEQHGVAYGIGRTAFCQAYNSLFSFPIEKEKAQTIISTGPGAVGVHYSASKNSFFTKATREQTGTLTASDSKDPPIVNDMDDVRYIVRRLTPTECARLQGFPDWWCSDLETQNPTADEIAWWRNVFLTYAKATGKAAKPKTNTQIAKWLESPRTDSAEYKMWGNGVALPCVVHVLSGISYFSRITGEYNV